MTLFADSIDEYTTIWAFSIPHAPAIIPLHFACAEPNYLENDIITQEIHNKIHNIYQDYLHMMSMIVEGKARTKWGQFLIWAVEDFTNKGKDHFLCKETEEKILYRTSTCLPIINCQDEIDQVGNNIKRFKAPEDTIIGINRRTRAG